MRRRDFIAGLGSATVIRPVTARAQQTTIPVIGMLSSAPFESRKEQVLAFHRGLREAGYVEGQNVAVEYRSADNQISRLPALANDLVDRRVGVIATITGDITAVVAKAATTTIPIVFVVGGDPVQRGLVASLNRPGGNLTGVSFLVAATIAKRLEILSQLMPAAGTVGVLVNPDNPNADFSVRDGEESARLLHKNLVVVRAATDSDLDIPFRSFAQNKIDSVLIDADPFFLAKREQLVGLVAVHRLPAIYSFREFASSGGLMSYGTSLSNAYRQVGNYVGRILKGEKPSELPVMQSTKFDFVINLKTAQSLGIEFPAKLLVLADEVIE